MRYIYDSNKYFQESNAMKIWSQPFRDVASIQNKTPNTHKTAACSGRKHETRQVFRASKTEVTAYISADIRSKNVPIHRNPKQKRYTLHNTLYSKGKDKTAVYNIFHIKRESLKVGRFYRARAKAKNSTNEKQKPVQCAGSKSENGTISRRTRGQRWKNA